MAKANVVEMPSTGVGDVHCSSCGRLLSNSGLPFARSDVNVYHLPSALIDKVNKMDPDRKFLLYYNCTIGNWRSLLDEFGVDVCRCGQILGWKKK